MSRKYVIKFAGLTDTKHKFEFQIDKKLFEEFEAEDILDADLFLNLTLDKSERRLVFAFKISGFIDVVCDRCLEQMQLPVNIEEEYYVKFGEKFEELDVNLYEIPHNEHSFDISRLIFDYVMLQKPMRCVHGEGGNKQRCNRDMSDMLDDPEFKEYRTTDPRWDALREINNLNNN